MPTIADQLRALADQLDATHTEAANVEPPPNAVAVRPTGPKGRGVLRWYPDPLKVLSGAGTPVSTLWGYAAQIEQAPWYCPHFKYSQQGGRLWGYPFTGGPADYPAAIDRLSYPEDWMTQEELDRQAAMAARDAATGATWSPR